jgi:type I restriction enzyme S subunit
MFVSDKFPTYELDTSRVDRDYLRWYFRCPPLWEQAREMSTGSAALSKLTLNPPRFLDLTIPLPSPDEQRRIVARIDRLAAKIDEANEMNRRIDVEIAALSASLHFSISKDRRVPMNSLIELSEDRVPVEPSLSYPQVGIRGFGGGLFGKPPLSGGNTTYRHFNRLSGKMLVLSQVKGWEGAIGVCPQELAGFFASPEYRTWTWSSGLRGFAHISRRRRMDKVRGGSELVPSSSLSSCCPCQNLKTRSGPPALFLN